MLFIPMLFMLIPFPELAVRFAMLLLGGGGIPNELPPEGFRGGGAMLKDE